MEDLFWFLVVAVGPFLLGAAIVFVLTRQRRLSRKEKLAQKKGIAEVYDEDGRGN